MESVMCDLCSSQKTASYQKLNDRFSGESFHLVRCENCGLVYLNPRPLDMAPYYPDQYEPHTVEEGFHQRRALDMQVDYLEKYASDRGSLLDIGCATGSFMQAAQKRGWEVSGFEPVERAAQAAHARGLDVFAGNLEDLVLPENSLEAVTMWDVLEHVPSPRSTLKKIATILMPGGVLVGSIPNLDSFDRRLFGGSWIGWDTPRHLALFNQDSLQQILHTSGFKLIDTRCFLGGRGAFRLSLEILWSGRQSRLADWLTRLSWPYRQLAYRIKRGPILAFAARRQENSPGKTEK